MVIEHVGVGFDQGFVSSVEFCGCGCFGFVYWDSLHFDVSEVVLCPERSVVAAQSPELLVGSSIRCGR